LETIIREYQQESKKLSPASSELCREIENLENLYQEKKEEIIAKEKSSNQSKEARSELLKKYKDYASKDNVRRIERNEQIEKTKEELVEKLEEEKQEKKEILFKNAGFFIGIFAIENALNIFSEARKKKIIPPNINPDFVKKLLDDGTCICKTDISKKNQVSRENVETLLDQLSKLGAQAGELVEKEHDMRMIKESKIHLLSKDLSVLNNNIIEHKKQIEVLTKEYEENESKIGDLKIDKDKIINFEEKNQEFNDQIEQIAGDINVLKNKIKELEWELGEKKETLVKENTKQEKGKELNKRIDFCEKAKKHSIQIQEKIMNEIRYEIQQETEEHYKELHWKKNEKIDILIDENYQIKALQNDYDKFGSFSAGEKALLATSFLIALNRVSGFKVPIIMDTALGRIDYGPRENFAKNIATYLKDNQIILLFTEAEYSPEVEKNLLPYINHLYRIHMPSEWVIRINEEKIK
jgi:DNA sulfur modification protein DndD